MSSVEKVTSTARGTGGCWWGAEEGQCPSLHREGRKGPKKRPLAGQNVTQECILPERTSSVPRSQRTMTHSPLGPRTWSAWDGAHRQLAWQMSETLPEGTFLEVSLAPSCLEDVDFCELLPGQG